MKKSITSGYVLRKQKKTGAHAFNRERVREAARELGKMGGKVGGPARAAAIGSDRTRSIAIHAACVRWAVPCYCDDCK